MRPWGTRTTAGKWSGPIDSCHCPDELAICSTRVLPCHAFARDAAVSNCSNCAYSSAIRLCRYCRSRSVSSIASSLQYRSMFCRWRRTRAVLKLIILRHLLGCSSVVFVDWLEELAAAPDSVDQREVKGRSGTTVSVRFFTKPHI